jgi:FkbM family methyltransferase
MLRHLGCDLPIQLWYQGLNELDDTMKSLVRKLDVQCIDAEECRQTSPCNRLTGWVLKPYAIINCPFKEVLLLDADNVPISNPIALFEDTHFKDLGAIFWPDYGRFAPSRAVWEIFGVPFHNEQEFETGQIVVDKQKCWNALLLTMWYNANSHFYYSYVYGDKDTFHLAFRKLGQPYAMVRHRIRSLSGTMCQHDFDGKRIFQHRNRAKWTLNEENRRIPGFLKENECLHFLDVLRKEWSGTISEKRSCHPDDPVAAVLTSNVYILKANGRKDHELTFNENGKIDRDATGNERRWDLRKQLGGTVCLQLYSETGLVGELALHPDGVWRSQWMQFGQPPIELKMTCVPKLRIGTTDEMTWKAVYEQNIYGLPERLCPNDVVLDVGAHIGAFSCACIARGARYVYAYEPDGGNFEQATNNVQKWFFAHNPQERHSPICLDNIAIFPSDFPGRMCIGSYLRSHGQNSLLQTGDCATLFCDEYDTPARQVDLDLILNELPQVTLLKLHCEGAEWSILFNSNQLDRVERIIVQVHSMAEKHKAANQKLPLEFKDRLEKYNVQSLVDHLAQRGFVPVNALSRELLSSGSLSSSDLVDGELGLLRFKKPRPVSEYWDW